MEKHELSKKEIICLLIPMNPLLLALIYSIGILLHWSQWLILGIWEVIILSGTMIVIKEEWRKMKR